MSRFEQSERILDAAESWRRQCLLEEGSLFTDRGLWTGDRFAELDRLFVENPDDSKDPFLVKLERQLEPGSPDAKCLWAEMTWVYRLIEVPASMAAGTKRQQIGQVWAWSGQDLPEENPLLRDEVLGAGVVNPGPAYNTHSWREYRFFVDAMQAWFSLDGDRRDRLAVDPWVFAEWLDGTEYADGRAFRHAMLFLLFPDDFEPIVSSQNKVTIVQRLLEGDPPDDSSAIALDRALLAIRERLEEDHPGFHFYQSPVWEMWQGSPGHEEVAGEAGAMAAGRPADRSLNTILYGPPGTGKTFRTVSRCVEICDGRILRGDELRGHYEALMDEGRVRFVTFHQSYGYEEFVEGIRPVEEGGQVVYRVEPGILKQIACEARKARWGEPPGDMQADMQLGGSQVDAEERSTGAEEPSFNQLWARLQERASGRPVLRTRSSKKQYVLALGEDGIELEPVGNGTSRSYSRERIRTLWESGFRQEPEATSAEDLSALLGTGSHGSYLWIIYKELWRLAQRNESPIILLTGEPALPYIEGAVRTASYALEGTYQRPKPGSIIERIYEVMRDADKPLTGSEVVEATYGFVRPQKHAVMTESDIAGTLRWLVTEERLHVVVSRFMATPISEMGPQHEATSGDVANFVLVIDEINRANVSKVMGELITLLEDDKREGAANEVTVTLPYSRTPFTLPANLHILGTMNTADRSIALLDTALRRRFEFEEVGPEPDQLVDAKRRTGIDLPRVLTAINERLEYLVDRDHLIGHAWLMGAKDRASLDDTMRRKVIPLIAEYFYDDWNKVRAVLGGTDAFVERVLLGVPPGVEPDVTERYRWTVREDFPETAYEDLLSGAGRPLQADG